jgi:hypothetical protein
MGLKLVSAAVSPQPDKRIAVIQVSSTAATCLANTTCASHKVPVLHEMNASWAVNSLTVSCMQCMPKFIKVQTNAARSHAAAVFLPVCCGSRESYAAGDAIMLNVPASLLTSLPHKLALP